MENHLQRGAHHATAAAGTVLSAVRVIARQKLRRFCTEGSLSANGYDRRTGLGHFTKGNGVGEPEIYAFLQQPGLSGGTERLPGMTMVRISAMENHLQRGAHHATAAAGTVLSVVYVFVRRTLRDLLTEGSISESGHARGTVLGHFTKDNGERPWNSEGALHTIYIVLGRGLLPRITQNLAVGTSPPASHFLFG